LSVSSAPKSNEENEDQPVMKPFLPMRLTCAPLLMIVAIGAAAPAHAQSTPSSASTCEAPAFKQVFTGTLSDFRNLPSRAAVGLAALGGVAAAGARSVDVPISRNIASQQSIREAFKPGAVIGGAPFGLSVALGSYAIARALHKPCAASAGADLVQAQLMAQVLTIGIKQAVRRSRPEGSGYSFPSGHSTAAFASATVLQRHFGWKVGLPAYGVAAFVAASRVEMKRHYLSDVAFGAALGVITGRAVSVGGGRRLVVTPIAPPDGAGGGVGFTWTGSK
jgi:membrane-associated phospholipid phosphatase